MRPRSFVYAIRCLMLALCWLAIHLSVAQAQNPPVTNGMLLWLDATDPATLFQDTALTVAAGVGDPVGGWMDKSGNAYHATQSDIFKQPTYDDTAMNGRAAVHFVGAEADGMVIDDGLQVFRPYTAFIVNQYWGNSRGRTLQSRDLNWLHGLWGGNPASFAEGWVSRNLPAEANFVYVEDTVGDVGGGSHFFVNGIDRTISEVPSAEPGRLGLVSEGQFPLEVSDADISEILIYDRVLDTAELTSVRDYLHTKYGASILPPDDPITPQNTVLKGQIGAFTGGDPGEGLDLEGVFVYAVDVGGFGGVIVGDVEFTDGSEAGMSGGESPGVSITDANEILNWHAPDYGDSPNDDELESVMQSIRWNTPPGLNIDLEVDPGEYQLQLLFAENCCDRGFDISVESDELSVDNFNVQLTQEGIANTTQGAYFRQTVSVTDGVLNIVLGGANPLAPDNNPILSALTLELLGPGAGPGDFNGDGLVNAADIDDLTTQSAAMTHPAAYDLNADALVNSTDVNIWVRDIYGTWIGDANLDSEFNSSDLVDVLASGRYEADMASTWTTGDFNGDGRTNSSDLVDALADGGYEQGPRVGAAVVPEPSSGLLLLTALALVATRSARLAVPSARV